MLSRLEGHELVQKTRNGIEAYLNGNKRFDPGPKKEGSQLWQRRGVFVTIIHYEDGTLRGCIGNPRPTQPLLIEAIRSGVLAATADPRFEPISLEDLMSHSCLELTVLSDLERITADNPVQFRDMIEIGKHGLLIDGFGIEGLLLPQVAVEENFDQEDFLSNCCLKAGLPADTWLSTQVKVFRFTGQIFSEKTPGHEIRERQLS